MFPKIQPWCHHEPVVNSSLSTTITVSLPLCSPRFPPVSPHCPPVFSHSVPIFFLVPVSSSVAKRCSWQHVYSLTLPHSQELHPHPHPRPSLFLWTQPLNAYTQTAHSHLESLWYNKDSFNQNKLAYFGPKPALMVIQSERERGGVGERKREKGAHRG